MQKIKSLEKNERIEDLQCGGLKIIQNSDLYCFTSDSVVLANFIKLRKNEKVLEIGAGSGVISILLSKKTQCENFVLIELQNEMANLCDKNITLNNLEEKLTLICDDVKNYKNYFKDSSFDVVFSNPPYMKGGELNENTVRSIARHENNLPLKNLIEISAKLLKNGGSFYIIYCADRTAELIHQLSNCKLEPKEMFFTENGKGKVSRVVVKAVKNGRPGVKVYPYLTTNDKDGNYIEKLQTKNFLD